MTGNEFQKFTRTTAQYPGVGTDEMAAITYLGLGLAGEAGEVAGKIKKIIRDSGGQITQEHRDKIRDEVSDVLWYAARLLDELDFNFDSTLKYNADKLQDRLNRNVIKGDGDNR